MRNAGNDKPVSFASNCDRAMKFTLRRAGAAWFAAGLGLFPGSAPAQTDSTVAPAAVPDSRDAAAPGYPNRPLRWIVPYAPGGGADTVARIVGQKLAESWTQQVVIDNRPGAAGIVGADVAAKAKPDGYTILMAATPHAVNVSLYNQLPFDLTRDFAAVTLVASFPNILVMHPSVPAASIKELVALAKSRPGQLNFASNGNGTSPHLAMELFKHLAGISMTHVPYKASSQALTDLLGGQVSLMFPNLPSALPHVKSRKLKALAVTGIKRSPAAPDIPTMAEDGVPGYSADTWNGILVPVATPGGIVAKLNSELVKLLNMPDMKERLLALGAETTGSTPEEFSAFIKAEITKWALVIKNAGIRAD
jgi:tripartite-type tricarboxylate transporter receptor subunit TctC